MNYLWYAHKLLPHHAASTFLPLVLKFDLCVYLGTRNSVSNGHLSIKEAHLIGQWIIINTNVLIMQYSYILFAVAAVMAVNVSATRRHYHREEDCYSIDGNGNIGDTSGLVSILRSIYIFLMH